MKSWKTLLVVAVVGVGLGALSARWLLSPRDYSPVKSRPGLVDETRRLEAEVPLAESKKPYLIVDLLSRRLIYRLSGMTLKMVAFEIDVIRGVPDEERLAQDRMALLVLAERGAPREVIKPPPPGVEIDPLKDPRLFPPDPPTDFILGFEQPVKVRVVGEKDRGWKEHYQGIRKQLRELIRSKSSRGEMRMQIRLPAEQAQELYRSLYQGEKVLFLGVPGPSAPAPRS